ncbi:MULTISPECIES: hypothetical protein [Klebsiella]|uniref:hypothetical protein n=1 Tax=Klebsiella TaxID=570 RepID=UPI0003BE4609|nr:MULTISPECIES: hypothetical protein [Klebsiella]EMF1918979.1 hypothetical protein [Klebsiella quasipneumoniae]HBR1456565.1 hypothetical protein [Klebsiella quasipneumoniae subsp. similipneumoniae]HCD1327456.1 hypothetical protein [Klebsiella variicola subsp. variicola]EKP7278719.1 hypothetical protein [Klebsiella pneumoniae]EKV3410317.1 hypothetical protein [Klebsiella variicola]
MDQDSQSTDSLFDYFYVDKERVNAITAQLFPSGVLNSIKQTSGESEKDLKELKAGLSLIGVKTNASESWNRSQERLFDSSWSIPLNLLDKLSESGRIKASLNDARLGDIVLIKGMMKIFDAQMVHLCMPIVKKIKINEMKNEKNPKAKGLLKESISEFENAEELVKMLPPTTHIDFADSYGNYSWMSVEPSNLTTTLSDVSLKYGPFIPGEWHILCIVDAYADDTKLDNPTAPYPTVSNDLKDAMNSMLIMMRNIMGRPVGSFGITPLIIFRGLANHL